MSFSPLIDQRPLLPNGGTDCAEACLGMVLGHLGHSVDMAAILAYHNGVTDISVLLSMCAHFGLTGCYETTSGFDNNDKLVITLIHDNAYANPDVTGSFEHFIVVYDQPNGNSIQAVNPWGARDINYPDSVFNPAYIAGIVVPIAVNAVTPTPTPGPSPITTNYTQEEESMNAPMWDATTAPWQSNQNIAWIKADGTLWHRWSGEQGQAGGTVELGTGFVSAGTIDLFVDPARTTVHLRARLANGGLWHYWEAYNSATHKTATGNEVL